MHNFGFYRHIKKHLHMHTKPLWFSLNFQLIKLITTLLVKHLVFFFQLLPLTSS